MQKSKSNDEQYYVYVQDIDGTPLMPTKRFRKVRLLLKKGEAKVVSYDPFTIKMLYNVGKEVQTLNLGIDTGTSNIGVSVTTNEGKELLSSTFKTNTLKIKGTMEKRLSHRHTRTRFKREKKKRRAIANNTHFKGVKEFMAYGAKTTTKYKVIRSSICRLEKKVKHGKLSNTAQHCLDNHINVVNKIKKILPIKNVMVEYASFDLHKLINPNVKGVDYQKGALYNELNHKSYVLNRDGHTCVLCNKRKKDELVEVHHVIYRSNGGADHFNNLVTLHSECHKKVHNDVKIEENLFNIIKQKDILKETIQTKQATILNSIMSRFFLFLHNNFEYVEETFGYETKAKRYEYGIDKSHNNDAFVISFGNNKPKKLSRAIEIEYEQFANNKRVFIYATTKRRYTAIIDGKKVTVYNRKKAMNQKEDSLEEFREKYTQKHVSQLKVLKGTVKFQDRSHYSFEKGDLVTLNGKLRVISGNTNNGKYVRLKNEGTTNFSPKELTMLNPRQNFRRINW